MKNLIDAIDYGISQGCNDVEIYMETSDELNIEVRDSKLEKYQKSKAQGIGVRVIKDNKQSLVYGTSDKIDALQTSIDEAIEILAYMDDDEIVIHSNDKFDGVVEKEKTTELANLTYDQKLEYLIEQEKQGFGTNDKKGLVESTTYDETSYSKIIVNSKGLNKKETGSYCGGAISLAINHDGVNETGYSYYYTRDVKDLLKFDIGADAYQRAVEMIGAGMVQSKKYTALFTPDVIVDLLRLLAYSFNGENIYKGKSLFKDKIGENVVSDKINIIDDGSETGALGFGFFDGDGINITSKKIISEGKFTGGLYNLSIGKKAGFSTTGSCSRSYSSLPSIGYHNLYLEKGNVAVADMLLELKEGIIIKELMGLHMANPITGEFSLGASGLTVKNGKISNGFRGVTISGNILDIFTNVVAVGDDFERRTSVGAPSLLIEDVIVSGS